MFLLLGFSCADRTEHDQIRLPAFTDCISGHSDRTLFCKSFQFREEEVNVFIPRELIRRCTVDVPEPNESAPAVSPSLTG
jgi:hypothetical protein